MTMTVSPTRRSEIHSTDVSWGTADEQGIASMFRATVRGTFVDVVLLIVAAVVLGVGVGFLLTDVAAGLATTLGTAVAFHRVLGTLTT